MKLVIIGLFFLLNSCSKKDEGVSRKLPIEVIDSQGVDTSFSYENMTHQYIKVHIFDIKGVSIAGKQVKIFLDNTDESNLLKVVESDHNGYINAKLSIGKHAREVYVVYIDKNTLFKRRISLLKSTSSSLIDSVLNFFVGNAYAQEVLPSYFPTKCNFGTLIYEDLWPEKGDYDFNDVVMKYNYVVNTKDGAVVSLEAKYIIEATGAGFTNGFGILLPIDQSKILSIEGQEFSFSDISLLENGVEAGGASNESVVIVTDNLNASIPKFSNVYSGRASSPAHEINLKILFTSGVVESDLGFAPFNPFLVVNRQRGREVHLPNFRPTSRVDESLFGTQDDTSNPMTKRFYKTVDNKPWALHMPFSLDHMQEKVDIKFGYKKIDAWAKSEGTTFTDWYLNLDGYRDDSKLIKLLRKSTFSDQRSCTSDEINNTEGDIVEDLDGGEEEIEGNELVSILDTTSDQYEDQLISALTVGPFETYNDSRVLLGATIQYDFQIGSDITAKNIGNFKNADGGLSFLQKGLLNIDGMDIDSLTNENVLSFIQVSPSTEEEYSRFLQGELNSKLFPLKSDKKRVVGSYTLTTEQIKKITSSSIGVNFIHSPAAYLQESDVAMGFDLNFYLKGKVSIRYLSKSKIDRGIIFDDSNIESEIRKQLSKYKGPITKVDCAQITSLKISNLNISSLKGLESCVNIESLDLGGNSLSDFSPIENLTSLTTLHIDSNPVSNGKFLENLTNLNELKISSTNITNLDFLKKLTNLTHLELEGLSASDHSPFKSLPELTYLNISNSSNCDMAHLANNSKIEYLRANNCKVENLPLLKTNNTLVRSIQMSSSQISDLNWLIGLNRLYEFTGNYNLITTIPDLSSLSALIALRLGQNLLKNIEGISHIKDKIQYLDLWKNTQMTGLDVLKLSFAALKGLNISNNPLVGAYLLGDYPKLVYLFANNTGLTSFSHFLNHPTLNNINLNNNSISDFSPLLSLSKLKKLSMLNNGLSNLGNIRGVWNQLNRIDLRSNPLACSDANALEYYTYLLKTVRYSDVSDCEITEPNPILQYSSPFEDVNLNYLVRLKIQKLEGDLVPSDLAGITYLDVGSKGITSLVGLQHLVDLKVLKLDNNPLSSFTPITSLSELETLDVSSTGFEFVKGLIPSSVKFLDIGKTDATIDSWLLEYSNLNSLDLLGNDLDCHELNILLALINRGVNVSYDTVDNCVIYDEVLISQNTESKASSLVSFSNLNSSVLEPFDKIEEETLTLSHPSVPNGGDLKKVTIVISVTHRFISTAKNFNGVEALAGQISGGVGVEFSIENPGLNALESFNSEADRAFEGVLQSTVDEYSAFRAEESQESDKFPQYELNSIIEDYKFELNGDNLVNFMSEDVKIKFINRINDFRLVGDEDLLVDAEAEVSIDLKVEYQYAIN